jgi:hypothetical protein
MLTSLSMWVVQDHLGLWHLSPCQLLLLWGGPMRPLSVHHIKGWLFFRFVVRLPPKGSFQAKLYIGLFKILLIKLKKMVKKRYGKFNLMGTVFDTDPILWLHLLAVAAYVGGTLKPAVERKRRRERSRSGTPSLCMNLHSNSSRQHMHKNIASFNFINKGYY